MPHVITCPRCSLVVSSEGKRVIACQHCGNIWLYRQFVPTLPKKPKLLRVLSDDEQLEEANKRKK